MKKAKIHRKNNRLLKTLYFTTAILIAALFIGSAVSASVARQDLRTQEINVKNNLKQHETPNSATNAIKAKSTENQASPAGISSTSYSPQSQPTLSKSKPMVTLGDIIFSQTYYMPEESWNFITSSVGLGYLVQEDFWDLTSAIGDIEWYGLSLIYSGGWTPGDPTGMTFEIKFYEDSGGAPGAEVASFSNLEPTAVDTGLLYGGYYPMWYWAIVLDSTVELTAGWVSIQSVTSPSSCNLLWAAGPEGNFNALQNGASTGANMAYSLTEPDIVYDHDIAISSIKAPATGNAAPITPVVKVKNNGLYTEYDVDIQLEIGKELITGTVEDFEATNGGYTHFPKLPQIDAWEYGTPTSGPMAAHSGSNLWATILGGNYPNGMWCSLVTPAFVVPVGAEFTFWHWYNFENSWDGGNVKISTDGGTTYTLITPEGSYPGTLSSNPYMTGQAGYTGNGGGWKKAVFDLSAYDGMLVQIMWETASDSSVTYPGWYIDDVGFTITSWVNVYDQTSTIPTILADETLDVTLPEWTPGDLGLVENVDINYMAEATNLFIDENANNDYKAKPFSLHYGWFNDVKVNAINSPINGLAKSQIPEVAIENVGQFDQSANVNMVISKIQYGSQWQVYNPSGGNTWVKDTSGPRTGTSCAKCTYEYTAVPNDDWLATPGNVVAPGGVFSFWVHGYTYNDDSYHVYLSTVGNTIDDFLAGTELFSGIAPPSTYTLKSFDLSAYEGQTVYCAIFYDGNYAWYIWVDDVTLPDGTFEGFEGTAFPPMLVTLIPEYDMTTTVDIAAGENMNVTLPEWFPEDLPVLMNIDYQADVTLNLNGFTVVGAYGFEDYVPPSGGAYWPFGWTQEGVNEWVQYSYPPSGWTAPCARLSYSAIVGDYATFVSPSVDTTGEGTLTLSFKSFIDWYADADIYCYVETRADSTDSWTDKTTWSNPITANVGPGTYTIDITDEIGPGTQVMFVFSGSAWDLDYWYIDDVSIGSAYWDFATVPGAPGYLPGWTEEIIVPDPYGATEQWYTVSSGTYPTCLPHEGTYMEEYNSWDVGSGAEARLKYDTPLDLAATGYSSILLNFWQYYSSLYGSDYVDVQASLDGSTWITIGHFPNNMGYGWMQNTVDLSAYASESAVYLAFLGHSYYGYNMFIDDITLETFAMIADGNPSDNTMSKMFTLSYEHDVGVATITEPSYTPPKTGDIIFHQGYWGPDESWAFNNAGTASGTVYLVQEDFYGLTDKIGDIAWWGLSLAYSGGWIETSPAMIFDIIFYEDNAGAPGAVYKTFTGLAPTYEDTGLDYIGFSMYKWSIDELPESVDLTTGWVSIQSQVPADNGNLMWATGPDGNSNALQNGVALLQNMAYDLSAAETQPGQNWPPGPYEVAGIVKNFGVTYTESNFDVNAQIVNNTGVVVYDETVTIVDSLAPEATVGVTFPDIIIPELPEAEGNYKLTMKTMLANDDHTNNDKKILNFVIQIPDTTPPISDAELSGTMGLNGWYVSDVMVTLTAYDPPEGGKSFGGKWPTGVKNIYYSFDNITFEIYTVPFEVTEDGENTVYYYADDNANNVENTKEISFKIDQTIPDITLVAEKTGFRKWKLTATATDDTSGMDKVEFYLDDALLGEIAAPGPYVWNYQGAGNSAQGIAYDLAGNSAISPKVNVQINIQGQQQLVVLKQKIPQQN